MEKENPEKIVELFNCGKLKFKDAEFYRKKGYSIIVNNGYVTNIIPPYNFENLKGAYAACQNQN